ncbi:MAG: 16S rRNA (cytosine(1402)-N(4))-methyltransferase RsmH [Ignavibacteria bacterium]|jgi:16S rRNA (cytosine1402-N4)-methyltransferase
MGNKKQYSAKRRPRVSDNPELQDYDYHLPVMLRECVDALMVCGPDGTYIDGTLGGGGHTAEILSRLEEEGRLISYDADPDAILHCQERFKTIMEQYPKRLTLREANFVFMTQDEIPDESISGVLLDLGVSSRQLDKGQRGISYRFNTKLDMRFGPNGQTAEELLNSIEEGKLHHILRGFGEEPFARIIARRVVERRRAAPLQSTYDLRHLIEECVPPHIVSKSLARVFQAIRIAVNEELDILEKTIRGIIPKLVSGGRIVILSYHSLEDRIVKHVFKELASKNDYNIPSLRIFTPKPIEAQQEEISRNPRARTAKLRIAEKC